MDYQMDLHPQQVIEVTASVVGSQEYGWERCPDHPDLYNVWQTGIETLDSIEYDCPSLWSGVMGLIKQEAVAQMEILLNAPLIVVTRPDL